MEGEEVGGVSRAERGRRSETEAGHAREETAEGHEAEASMPGKGSAEPGSISMLYTRKFLVRYQLKPLRGTHGQALLLEAEL